MDLVIKKSARDDLQSLEPDIRNKIINRIEDLQHKATPEESMYIKLGNLELFRLKLQEEDRNSRLNHRIFYQIEDDTVYIRGVFHRSKGYGTETREELNDRIE